MLKKFKQKILSKIVLGGTLLFGFLSLNSCENTLEIDDPSVFYPTINVVKKSEVYAYSGGQALGMSTRTSTTSGNVGDIWYGHELQNEYVAPSNITEDEKNGVIAALDEKVTGEQISEDIVLPWDSYWLQDVVSAVETDTPSKSYTFEAYNKGTNCSSWHNGDNVNYSDVANNGQITNFYTKGNNEERIDKTALMTNMQNGTYEEMQGKQFRWYINCHENLHWSEYILVKYEDNYYICFDFACGYKENDVDGNSGRGNTQNDWDYNDWIIKISPAIPTNNLDKQFPIWPDLQDGDTQLPGDGETTVVPSEVPDHVEINLSIEERDNVEWLASHLSIHVRAITDVEVFIPLPSKYYCALDDMAIVNKHDETFMVYGGPQVTTYNVDGNLVTLSVLFERDGIRVTTQGINEDVIDYCQENFGDGLTFEVWNYMNLKVKDWSDPKKEHGEDVLGFGQENQITVEELRGYLNDSTVEFTNTPSLYVNAFMYTPGCTEEEHECGRFEDDCIVSIVSEQELEYMSPETTYWFNSSPYNELYYKR